MPTSNNTPNKQNNQYLDDIYADIKRKQRQRRIRTKAIILILGVTALVGGAYLGSFLRTLTQ